MNHHQIEKNGMYKKMQIFFANPTNVAVWTGFARLTTEITNFGNLNNSLASYMQQHQTDITGITTAKNNAFAAMVSIIVNKAQKAYVWAIDNANYNLAEVFDVQKSDFLKGSEITAFTKIKNIRDSITANIAAMASVQLVAADVTAINAAITAYQNTVGTTGSAQARKTQGTKGLESIITSIDNSLSLIDKLMINSYSSTKPDFIKEYTLNRQLDKLPTHHNGISITVTDEATGEELEGALLSINDKTSLSDIDGVAEIIKIKQGTYNATVSLDGYVSQTLKVVIEIGTLVEIDVKLAKV